MSAKTIFITGASSGIGRALAERMAAPGVVLGLAARRLERLEALKTTLEARGARTLVYQADVRSLQEMQRVAESFLAEAGSVEMVVANAGIGGSQPVLGGDGSRLSDIIAVNVQGVIHTLLPFIPAMVERQSGHLAAVGSVAGFRGLGGRSAYNASKAAVKTLMDGFRMDLRPHGVQVTTLCPGFVESELTARNQHPMPFFLKAERAAALIERALARKKKTYVFPWQWRMLLPLIVRAPDWMVPGVK